MEREQLYAAVIVIGVIFSILTNVALYYYGEAKDLKRKVNQGEYLYVRGEDWIEREIRKHHDDRLTQLENRIDNLVSTEFDNRVDLKNELFVMRQEVDLIKFTKGISKENITHNFEEIKKNLIELKTRVKMLESDEEVVKKEFLFGHIRDVQRQIAKVQNQLNGKGVNDGTKKG
jgi:hypothetical protein